MHRIAAFAQRSGWRREPHLNPAHPKSLKPVRTSTEAPAVHRSRIELRVLGTSVTLQEHIRKQAEQDLGIKLRFMVDEGSAVQRNGVMHPHSYDVYDQWFHSIDCLWPARAARTSFRHARLARRATRRRDKRSCPRYG
jgi:hypothetical protein